MEQQNDKNPKAECIIALICFLAPFIVTLILTVNWGAVLFNDIFFGLMLEVGFLLAYIVGFIIIINVRIQYPQYGFGKVVMGMYIVGTIIIIATIWTAVSTCLSCIDCINDCS